MSHEQTTNDPQVTVNIRCRIGWRLLQEYDNSGNNSTAITRHLEVKHHKEITWKDYSKVVNEFSRKEAQK